MTASSCDIMGIGGRLSYQSLKSPTGLVQRRALSLLLVQRRWVTDVWCLRASDAETRNRSCFLYDVQEHCSQKASRRLDHKEAFIGRLSLIRSQVPGLLWEKKHIHAMSSGAGPAVKPPVLTSFLWTVGEGPRFRARPLSNIPWWPWEEVDSFASPTCCLLGFIGKIIGKKCC